MPNRRLPWSLPNNSPNNPKGPLKQSSIPSPAQKLMAWDGHIPIWTVSGGYAQLKGSWATLTTIPKGHHSYDTTFRHADFVDDEGTRSTIRGPNVVFADAHVEQRIGFQNRNDDHFNIPSR